MEFDDNAKMSQEFKIILFYKFHSLAKDRETVELYRLALETLCKTLELHGRILVGCNEHQSEGINGTLSGEATNVKAFVYALSNFQFELKNDNLMTEKNILAIQTFWNSCHEFYVRAKCQPLVMNTTEFKWSNSDRFDLFPDLNIKLVNELIGTGGVLADIPLSEVHQGYLTPAEWHERISKLEKEDDTILIDCRNTKECQIGHFPNSIDPNTTTVRFDFSLFIFVSIFNPLLISFSFATSLTNFQNG